MLNSDVSLSVSYNFSDYVKYEIKTKCFEDTDYYVKGLNYFSKMNKMKISNTLIKTKVSDSPLKSPKKVNVKV